MKAYAAIRIAGVLAAFGVAGASAEFVKFRGRVVDGKGKPVRDAVVGLAWTSEGKKFESAQTLEVAKDGSFEGELDVDAGKPVVLVAFDKTQRRGGFSLVPPDQRDGPQKIEIANLIALTGHFDVSNIRGNPETVEMVFESRDNAPILRVELPSKKRFNVKVPAGEYILRLGCSGGEREPRELTIPAGKPAHDLKEKLALSPVTARRARVQEQEEEKGAEPKATPRKGQAAKAGSAAPPPLTITDAIGVPKTMKLADYKGKWVLLEFWGYW